ncbi:hypothetical protein RJ639_022715, partial [Escallonia herrerae]
MEFIVARTRAGREGDDELAHIKPLAKILTFKSIVFLTGWQVVAIALLYALGYLNVRAQALQCKSGVQDFIICIELTKETAKLVLTGMRTGSTVLEALLLNDEARSNEGAGSNDEAKPNQISSIHDRNKSRFPMKGSPGGPGADRVPP